MGAHDRRVQIEEEIRRESKKIEFFTLDFMVETIRDRMERNELFVPSYQRHFRWKDDTRHKFIESLLLRLPIPFVFLWETEDLRMEIVDGSQRLRTIELFVTNRLQLGQLDRIPSASNLTFEGLPEAIQRRLLSTPVRAIVLNEEADLEARRDLFNRINTTSEDLTPAETRRGITVGRLNSLIEELRTIESFRAVAPMTASDEAKRLDEELIARFFAYSHDLSEYRDKVKEFIMDFTVSMNGQLENDSDLEQELRNRFEMTMQFVRDTYPMGARRSATGKKSYNARFEAVTIGAYRAITAQPSLLVTRPNITKLLSTDKFNEIVTGDGANAKSRLVSRIEYVETAYLSTVEQS